LEQMLAAIRVVPGHANRLPGRSTKKGGSIGHPAGEHDGVGSPWQEGRAGHRLSLTPVPSQSEQGRPEAVTATAYASVDHTEARKPADVPH
jgi:hypothetical protein